MGCCLVEKRVTACFECLGERLNVTIMKRSIMALAAAIFLAGCHTAQESSSSEMGGTGAGTTYESGYDSSTQTNRYLPGGDARPNRDGESLYGISP